MNRKGRKGFQIKYRLEFNWSPEDNVYVVRVPELEGCITHGETPEEALTMAEQAIEAYIASLQKHGEKIPAPLADKSFSGKIPLRIDRALHRKLAIEASIEDTSLNKLIEEKLKKAT